MRKAASCNIIGTALSSSCESSTTAFFAAVAARTLPGRGVLSTCNGDTAAAYKLNYEQHHTRQGIADVHSYHYNQHKRAVNSAAQPCPVAQQQQQQQQHHAFPATAWPCTPAQPALAPHSVLNPVVKSRYQWVTAPTQQRAPHSWCTAAILPQHHQLMHYATTVYDKKAAAAALAEKAAADRAAAEKAAAKKAAGEETAAQKAAKAAGPVGREAVSHRWCQSEIVSGLQHIGLEPSAAMAVWKAWQVGFRGYVPRLQTGMQHRLIRYKQQQSPLRLISRVRRLVRAHEATAAAAAGGVKGPEAAAAAAAAWADSAAAPTWGQLDVSSLLTTHPQLLMLPPKYLESALNTLLQGLSQASSPFSALSYVATRPESLKLLTQLERLSNNLVSLHEVYTRVVGVPPKPKILANVRVSYLRITSDVVGNKLQEYVNRFGQQTTHALISAQPNLLSSNIQTVLDRCDLIAEVLEMKSSEVHTALQRAPRLLTFSDRSIRSNAARLKHQLTAVGLNARQVLATLRKCPLLLAQSPVTIAAKIQGLRELLGDSEQSLAYFIRSQPTLMMNSSQTMHARMAKLAALLQMDRSQLCSTVGRYANILQLDPDHIANKLAKQAEVLGLEVSSLLLMVRQEPSIICMAPASMNRKLQHLCSTMGWNKKDLVQAVRANPRALSYDVRLLADYLALIQRLAAASDLWLHGGACGPKASTNRRQQQQQYVAMQDNTAVLSSSSSSRSKSRRKNTCWPIAFAKSISERLPLRMEYLVSIGQQEKVPLVTVFKTTAAVFEQQYPDFNSWAELRLRSLQLDPSHWSPGLVNKAVAAAKQPRAPAALPWSRKKAQHALQQQQQHLAEQVQQQQQQQQQTNENVQRLEKSVSAAVAAAAHEQQATSVLTASDSVVAAAAAVHRRRRRRVSYVSDLEATEAVTAADVQMQSMPQQQQQQQQHEQDSSQLAMQFDSASVHDQQRGLHSEHQAGFGVDLLLQQQQLLYDVPGLLLSAGSLARAWYTVPAQQQQHQYQQQCDVAGVIAAAATPVSECWQQQQQRRPNVGFSHPAVHDFSSSSSVVASSWQQHCDQWGTAISSSSSNAYVDGLLPGLIALQEAGYWVAARFSGSSSSSRCEQLLTLSELLRQRSRQLAVAGGDWRAAACSG